ncbi:DUF6011 domain-containing protein [Streptomyces cinereoruber]|uniref:DUF6011 domain-containing protein n=1 Tax=Streptomyces cinereoruber TaxID=67260 RepID=UPI0036310310
MAPRRESSEYPELDAIEPGYYAILDPDDDTRVTYWRRVRNNKVDSLRAWPPRAAYGPPSPSRLPADPRARYEAAMKWSKKRREYLDRVVAAIGKAPEAAARCFADLQVRCWSCARALKDDKSKVLGIGPDCRSGMDPGFLARYSSPEVGRAHAEHLTALRAAAEVIGR